MFTEKEVRENTTNTDLTGENNLVLTQDNLKKATLKSTEDFKKMVSAGNAPA